MKCKFRGCESAAEDGFKTCTIHRYGKKKTVFGDCECGRKAQYSSGQCGTCYAREWRQKKHQGKDLNALREKDRDIRQSLTYYMSLVANPITLDEARNRYIRSMGWDDLKLLYPELCKHADDFGVVPPYGDGWIDREKAKHQMIQDALHKRSQ